MMFALPWCFFDPTQEKQRRPKTRRHPSPLPAQERRLFCSACRRVVTTVDACCSVNGAHQHRCTNPHGLTFDIGCFRDAPGCTVAGQPTAEHTWFPGYAWDIALCVQCRTHLGWQFASSADGFYGLIVARLTSRGEH
jgi:hypothetical protein